MTSHLVVTHICIMQYNELAGKFSQKMMAWIFCVVCTVTYIHNSTIYNGGHHSIIIIITSLEYLLYTSQAHP